MKKITDERLDAIVNWHKAYSPPWIYEGWKDGELSSLIFELQERRKTDKLGKVLKS